MSWLLPCCWNIVWMSLVLFIKMTALPLLGTCEDDTSPTPWKLEPHDLFWALECELMNHLSHPGRSFKSQSVICPLPSLRCPWKQGLGCSWDGDGSLGITKHWLWSTSEKQALILLTHCDLGIVCYCKKRSLILIHISSFSYADWFVEFHAPKRKA